MKQSNKNGQTCQPTKPIISRDSMSKIELIVWLIFGGIFIALNVDIYVKRRSAFNLIAACLLFLALIRLIVRYA